jgi:C4-dicarboxylate-binding protein DctP
VRVELFPDGKLYGDKDEVAALQLGAVQMLAPSLSKISAAGFPEFELFDLPFLFDDYADVRKVTEGRVGRRLLGLLEAKGIHGLAYWDNGFKSFSADRPLRELPDFAGLRVRIQPSRVLAAQMRALGADPIVLGFSDLIPALREHVVQAAENPISNFVTQRMDEVQRHLTLTRHGYLGYAVVVNARFWAGLPWRTRRQLERAMEEATAFSNSIARQRNDEDLARLVAAGTTLIHEPTAAQREALRRALLPVHERVAATVGRELIEDVYEATGFVARR